LYDGDKGDKFPDAVKWLTLNNRTNAEIPIILKMDEIQKMIQVANNPRDKAIVAVLYDSGCRASEIADLKLKDVTFENQYATLTVQQGKTGSRVVFLTSSMPDLKAWVNNHPKKDDPEASLFCTLGKKSYGRPMETMNLRHIIRKLAKDAGIKRNVNLHLFRHTKATHTATYLTESERRVMFGWSKNSNTPSIYTHLSGGDVKNKILQMAGIEQEAIKPKFEIPTYKCWRCAEVNSVANKFCWKCYAVLTQKGIEETQRTLEFVTEILPVYLERIQNREVDLNELEGVSNVLKKLKEGDKNVK